MQKFYSSKKDRSRGSVFHSVDKENSRHDDRNDSEQPAKESKEKRRHRDDRHSDAKRKKRRRSRSASRNHEKRPRRSRSAGDDVKERPRLEMNSRCAAARLRSRSACSCRRDQKRDRDTRLPEVNDDPRKNDNKADTRRVVKTHGKGRNTESFDPASTLVRPAMRVIVGPNRERYGVPVKHDDLIMVPNFFCQEDDWSLYYNRRTAQGAG
eukprot:GEMP01032115.1.p1 GENE.GEMP01032115.1~~GEMP01032115.1.p1  ORF type:complete len:231 (+),score=33.45 GEMP01032115.1:66-695(+)